MNQSRYLEAVEAALEDGCTDAAEGGVPPGEVAQRLDIHHRSATDRLTRLVESGELVVVDGVDPETYSPRKSYLPRE